MITMAMEIVMIIQFLCTLETYYIGVQILETRRIYLVCCNTHYGNRGDGEIWPLVAKKPVEFEK